ncbi:hypothetical protein [Humibacter ginsenosidimutans]|uniref:Uncharacterized protein n=1 Tax=Humibacter ginsenosidimutans TaxID=2599293 RepID=A0A5B8M7V0_9MICO|nr:hypothetical protein [Humibacter ginsenosidimutans]QDZ16301.1 hypothetical protein FPZ11_17465 [Humibacter ginsenosidimutans]
MTHPNSFKDGEFGFAPSVFLGGPFDGDRYRLPILPDGDVPSMASLPTASAGSAKRMAAYARHNDEPIGGCYVFIFEGYNDAGGESRTAEQHRQTAH